MNTESTSSEPKVMKRDVYDALELSAMQTGGFLPGVFFADHRYIPACIFGHAAFLDLPDDHLPYFLGWDVQNGDVKGPVIDELVRLGFDPYKIDEQFAPGGNWDKRTPFRTAMKRLNVVRGDK